MVGIKQRADAVTSSGPGHRFAVLLTLPPRYFSFSDTPSCCYGPFDLCGLCHQKCHHLYRRSLRITQSFPPSLLDFPILVWVFLSSSHPIFFLSEHSTTLSHKSNICPFYVNLILSKVYFSGDCQLFPIILFVWWHVWLATDVIN